MNKATPAEVEALRKHLQDLLDEDLLEEHLAQLWPSIETEWVRVFPETQALLKYLQSQATQRNATDQALAQLVTVCERHLSNLEEAAGYRDEADKLKKAAADTLRHYDELLNKKPERP